ncbi:hypothetical protein [Frankia sp. Cr1]|nr:hypothetical protein [Frankia sp. Cr1]
MVARLVAATMFSTFPQRGELIPAGITPCCASQDTSQDASQDLAG